MLLLCLVLAAPVLENETGIVETSSTEQAGVWSLSSLQPAGTHTYHVGSSAPLTLTLAADTTVIFYYATADGWLTSDQSRVPIVAGDFQSELGCPDDWQAECLVTMMRDVERDGSFVFRARVAAGTWAYKVALNRSWGESYPAANAGFNATTDPTVVTFRWTDSGDPAEPLLYPPIASILRMSGGTFPLGAPVTITATVDGDPSGDAPPATGDVLLAGATSGTVALGQTLSLGLLALGIHVVAGQYNGDVSYELATAESTVTVVPASLAITATGPTFARVDEPLVIHASATVLPPSTLTFDGAFALQENGAVLATDPSRFDLSFAARGKHTLDVHNVPSTDFMQTSASVNVEVKGFPSSAILSLEARTLVVEIRTEGIATGYVALFRGNAGSEHALSNGRVELPLDLPAGRYTFQARYDGDLRHEPASSAVFTIDISDAGVPTEVPAETPKKTGCAQTTPLPFLLFFFRRRR